MIWNDRIKEMRLRKELTLKQAADYLGIAEATAQRYESGVIKSVPYEILIGYANLFSCSPAFLMGWDSDSDLCLSSFERELILAYRSAPESRKEAVRTLLEIVEELPKKIASESSA